MKLQHLEAIIHAMKSVPELQDSTADVSIGESATYFEVDADLFKEAIKLLEAYKDLILLGKDVLEKYDQMMIHLAKAAENLIKD